MTDVLFKLVNVLGDKGQILRDDRGRALMVRIEMTEEEALAFEAERGSLGASPIYSPLQFMEMFTDEEQLAIVSATMNIPAVKLWYDKMLAAQVVDLSDERVLVGLSALVSANLLTQERVDQLLGGA